VAEAADRLAEATIACSAYVQNAAVALREQAREAERALDRANRLHEVRSSPLEPGGPRRAEIRSKLGRDIG
jgi:hypothetical protein